MTRRSKEQGEHPTRRHKVTRRQFVASSLQGLAGAALASPLLWLEGCGRPPWMTNRSFPRVLADLHVHSGINAWNKRTPLGIQYPGIAGLAETTFNRSGLDWEDCYDAGVDLLCSAHFNAFDEWLSMPTDPDPEAMIHTTRMIDLLEHELATDASRYARVAVNPDQLSAMLRIPKSSPDWRVAVVHTIEGAHALGGRIEKVEPLARRGVAMIGLTHFFNKGVATSANAYPFFPDANSPWPALGLSSYGADLIKEIEHQRVIVDVIHASTTALEDILKVTTRPMVASHTSARTLGDHPYSLIDEHLQEIAGRDGLIGVILDPYLLSNYATAQEAEDEGSLRDVVRTIRYLVKLVGHQHVGIGTDFAGFVGPPRDMNRVSQIGRLRSALVEEFGDQAMVLDIMAQNTINFILKNWKPRA